jgi:hypothetical protein
MMRLAFQRRRTTYAGCAWNAAVVRLTFIAALGGLSAIPAHATADACAEVVGRPGERIVVRAGPGWRHLPMMALQAGRIVGFDTRRGDDAGARMHVVAILRRSPDDSSRTSGG